MSAPHQLTEAQRELLLTGHYAFSHREMVRHWFLSAEDLKRVNQRRREHNRLGYAVQLCLLRYPGWSLKPAERVPPNLLRYVGQQLGAEAAEFVEYAQRDNTRQEHGQLLIQDYRFRSYEAIYTPLLQRHLEGEALATDSAFALVKSALEWLRERRIILPALATIEALVRSVRRQVEREVYERLFGRLTESQRAELNKWLELGPSHGSLLGWLRRVPHTCSAAGILDLLQRLQRVRDAALPSQMTEGIAPPRLDQLAARGARHSVAHFRRFPAEKRYSILAAFLLRIAEELTDRALDFHRRLIARLFREAENQQWTEFVQQGSGVNEKLHNYARLTAVIGQARKEHRPLEEAIAEAFAWEALERDGQEAARLARPAGEASFQNFRAQFPSFRQYTPKFLEAFQFEAIPAYQSLLKALDTLRAANRQQQSEIPSDAPRAFVKQKWVPFVFTESGIDRCYYELCALSELSWGLKSGDIWVRGSRRYRKFDHYLIESSIWAQRKERFLAQAEPSLDGETYLRGRTERLDQQLQQVATLMRQHQLPEARLEGTRLVLSPLTRSGLDQAEKWTEKLYSLLPRISLTQLLEEVDNWTQFTKSFTHLYTGQPTTDRSGLLTTILADATNLGKTRMAEATEKYTADRLAWMEDWYFREATYSHALTVLIKRQSEVPLASQWDRGRTSSSDGQAFPIAFRKPVLAQTNAKYGRDPVVLFYTHISDRYTPFYAQAISSTVRDATYVLDGLLHHQTDLAIEEHYTDTSGYTDHIFALCHLLGFRFAPRIRDLGDHRLFSFEKPSQYEGLKPLLGGRIHVRTIREHWDEIARLITSLRQGTVSPSLLVSKLAGHPRQNHLFVALREIGRIERSLFTLEWLQNPELRRRVTAGLNKGVSFLRSVDFPKRHS